MVNYMTFYCIYCDYQTRDNYCLKRHRQSKKHQKKYNMYQDITAFKNENVGFLLKYLKRTPCVFN